MPQLRFHEYLLFMVRPPEGYEPAPCAEFPSDNPALHLGASWTCLAPTGPLKAVVRPLPGSCARPVDPPRAAGPPPSVEAPEAESPVEPPRLLPPRPAWVPTAAELKVRPGAAGAGRPRRKDPFQVATSVPLPEEAAENLALCLGALDAHVPRAPRAAPAAPAAPEGGVMEPSPVPPGVVPCLPPIDDVVVLAPAPLSNEVMAARATSASPTGPSAPALDEEPPALAPVASEPESESSAFDAFVAALVDTALSCGATRAAALIPPLLTAGRADRVDGESSVAIALTSAGLAEHSAGSLIATAALEGPARAWRGVLLGQSEDFSACGDSTLDDWAAHLLEGFGVGSGERGFKRELRARGVAAFGMLDAA